MKGILLLPTLNRIELLKTFIKSYKDSEAQTQVAILIDQDDLKSNDKGYKEVQEYITEHSLSLIELINTHEAVTMGDKIRYIFPKIESIVPDCQWVGLLNDDHYIVTKHWDKIVNELIDGKNFISTNDGYWNFGYACCGLTVWSKELLQTVDFPIYPKGLQHLFIDNLWKAIGESTGSWEETMRINVEHRHVFKGAMPADETHIKSNNQERYNAEEKVFRKFMEEDFKDVCMRIVKMRSEENLDSKFT